MMILKWSLTLLRIILFSDIDDSLYFTFFPECFSRNRDRLKWPHSLIGIILFSDINCAIYFIFLECFKPNHNFKMITYINTYNFIFRYRWFVIQPYNLLSIKFRDSVCKNKHLEHIFSKLPITYLSRDIKLVLKLYGQTLYFLFAERFNPNDEL